MAYDTVYLETLEVCNGWTILRRYGAEVLRQRLPRYIISTPDGRHLEEFRRLDFARYWCHHNDDYAERPEAAKEC